MREGGTLPSMSVQPSVEAVCGKEDSTHSIADARLHPLHRRLQRLRDLVGRRPPILSGRGPGRPLLNGCQALLQRLEVPRLRCGIVTGGGPTRFQGGACAKPPGRLRCRGPAGRRWCRGPPRRRWCRGPAGFVGGLPAVSSRVAPLLAVRGDGWHAVALVLFRVGAGQSVGLGRFLAGARRRRGGGKHDRGLSAACRRLLQRPAVCRRGAGCRWLGGSGGQAATEARRAHCKARCCGCVLGRRVGWLVLGRWVGWRVLGGRVGWCVTVTRLVRVAGRRTRCRAVITRPGKVRGIGAALWWWRLGAGWLVGRHRSGRREIVRPLRRGSSCAMENSLWALGLQMHGVRSELWGVDFRGLLLAPHRLADGECFGQRRRFSRGEPVRSGSPRR